MTLPYAIWHCHMPYDIAICPMTLPCDIATCPMTLSYDITICHMTLPYDIAIWHRHCVAPYRTRPCGAACYHTITDHCHCWFLICSSIRFFLKRENENPLQDSTGVVTPLCSRWLPSLSSEICFALTALIDDWWLPKSLYDSVMRFMFSCSCSFRTCVN